MESSVQEVTYYIGRKAYPKSAIISLIKGRRSEKENEAASEVDR